MSKLRFIQIEKDDMDHYEIFREMIISYSEELEFPLDYSNLLNWIQSMVNIQGPYDRHLEIAFSNEEPVGFLYGKVDHEDHRGYIKLGYGYIMEFYIKPEFRRKGYGKAMFEHLEHLFSEHGVRRMYLNTDNKAGGEQFWRAMGYLPTNVIQPQNKKVIFERDVFSENKRPIYDMITIQISEYLSHELVKKIAALRWNNSSPKNISTIRRLIHDGKYFSDSFTVIAVNTQNDVIGHIFCLKNRENPKHWYYGDLIVDPVYRRLKIASKMINTAIQRISDQVGQTICCYVEPSNSASINLQKSLNFKEVPFEKFDNRLNEGRLMFKRNIGPEYNIILAAEAEAAFVHMLYCMNKSDLHGCKISLDEWKDALSKQDTDEVCFLTCRGAIPCAFIKISGLNNKDLAWVRMLAVSDKYRHQGIGKFTLSFVEEYLKLKRIGQVGVKIPEDNVIAQELFKRRGYTEFEDREYATDDDIFRKGIIFIKELHI